MTPGIALMKGVVWGNGMMGSIEIWTVGLHAELFFRVEDAR